MQSMPQQQQEQERGEQRNSEASEKCSAQDEFAKDGSIAAATEAATAAPGDLGTSGVPDVSAWLEALQIAEQDGQAVGLATVADNALLGGAAASKADTASAIRARGATAASGTAAAAAAGSRPAVGWDKARFPGGGSQGPPVVRVASCSSMTQPEQLTKESKAGSQCAGALLHVAYPDKHTQLVAKMQYQQRLEELLCQLEIAEEQTGRFLEVS